MQSHDDRDFGNDTPSPLQQQYSEEQRVNLDALESKARDMLSEGGSQITWGKPGEVPLLEAEVAGIAIRRMPDDALKVIRISLGESEILPASTYLTFRGDPYRVTSLLRRALRAMEFRF